MPPRPTMVWSWYRPPRTRSDIHPSLQASTCAGAPRRALASLATSSRCPAWEAELAELTRPLEGIWRSSVRAFRYVAPRLLNDYRTPPRSPYKHCHDQPNMPAAMRIQPSKASKPQPQSSAYARPIWLHQGRQRQMAQRPIPPLRPATSNVFMVAWHRCGEREHPFLGRRCASP